MSGFASRMIAQVLIEFDTGSNYGGGWTFEAAHKDAERAVRNKCAKIATACGVTILSVESIRSHVVEQKNDFRSATPVGFARAVKLTNEIGIV